MRISAELPIGVAALIGAAASRLRRLEGELAGELDAAGFEEALLPLLDYVDPYQPILGPAAQAELYRFVDRDGELLAVRADFTPMLARLLAPRLEALGRPARVFYRGEVVRRDADHPGRRRALWQLGAEILGVEGEAAEHEALERFLGLLALAGVAAPRIVVSVAGALDRVLQQGRTRSEALELAAAVERRDRSMVRGVPALLGVVETGLPADLGSLGDDRLAARLEHLEGWCRDLEKGHPGLMVRLDLAEFAGQTIDPELAGTGGARSYYDGLVFRAFAGRGFLPVGSGGRYDSLYQRLGAATTAVGFSIGLDRLVEVLEEEPTRAATSALGRPTEALGRPTEALGRPTEALGRPTEALGRPAEVTR